VAARTAQQLQELLGQPPMVPAAVGRG